MTQLLVSLSLQSLPLTFISFLFPIYNTLSIGLRDTNFPQRDLELLQNYQKIYSPKHVAESLCVSKFPFLLNEIFTIYLHGICNTNVQFSASLCTIIKTQQRNCPGSSVLKVSPSNAQGTGSIPGLVAQSPHASGPKQHIEQKQCYNKFNKDFKKRSTSKITQDFPGGPVVKNSPANAGDVGLIPGQGRFHMPQGN